MIEVVDASREASIAISASRNRDRDRRVCDRDHVKIDASRED